LTTNVPLTYVEDERPFLLEHDRHLVVTWGEPLEAGLEETAERFLERTLDYWRRWVKGTRVPRDYQHEVVRSALALKLHQYEDTGALLAATTTSIPEHPGSGRTWDYRFCWLRDATFTLMALLNCGLQGEAKAWREWLLRAVAGDPTTAQIMYGLAGERRLTELELDWLPGYEGSRPVRIGNAASRQFQLDVYGEVMDAMYHARKSGLDAYDAGWPVVRALIKSVEEVWEKPDEGIWEVRGPRQHFTHSKVMAWVAIDRAVKTVETYGRDGPLERWRALRDTIHAQICERGFDTQMNSFVQVYGSKLLDASLLMIPLVGFLPPDDPRVRGTLHAIEQRLLIDGFVMRYDSEKAHDGLPPGEGAFLACSFWLADNYALVGRREEAERLFERLLSLRNDVGLLAEEYDPRLKRQVGNFPQAFSHVGLVNTALNLARPAEGPAETRGKK
jgi:GH15 family glucan-1,4-alpha-glucosidase